MSYISQIQTDSTTIYQLIDRESPQALIALPYDSKKEYLKGDFFLVSEHGKKPVLYKTTQIIPVGTQYSTDTNVVAVKITEELKRIYTDIANPMHFLGVIDTNKTTLITDNSTVQKIVLKSGTEYSADEVDPGDFVIQDNLEFICSTDKKWHELGTTSQWGKLGNLAYKDAVLATFNGSVATLATNVTPTGSITSTAKTENHNYKPSGDITTPTITVNTTPKSVINSVTFGGKDEQSPQAKLTLSEIPETLKLEWVADTRILHTTSANVIENATAVLDSAPVFTGEEVDFSFEGIQESFSTTYTPAGSVVINYTDHKEV